jgi:hypothetical protein
LAVPPVIDLMQDGILRAIGTHHKTGTVLMYKIFRDLSKALGLAFFTGPQEEIPPGTEIWLEDHSHIDPSKLDRPLVGVHVVRHPYEILASAYRYHLVCQEDWCVSPGYADPDIVARPDLRQLFATGHSYQQVLRSLSLSEGLRLEIWRSRRNILYMADWDYSDPRYLECQLEDLSQDFDGTILKVFSHLDLLKFGAAEMLKIAAAHDVSRWPASRIEDDTHVTNKGQKSKFEDIFKTEHFQLVGELFPEDLLTKLGYEAE